MLRRCAAQQTGATGDQHVRLCASHRELHVPFSAPFRSDPHARVFGFCTAGEDAEVFGFAAGSLRDQLRIHLRVLEALRKEGPRIGLTTVAFSHQPVDGLEEMLRHEVIAPLAEAFPGVRLLIDGDHPRGRRYYAPVGFTVVAEDHAGVAHMIGVGGFTVGPAAAGSGRGAAAGQHDRHRTSLGGVPGVGLSPMSDAAGRR